VIASGIASFDNRWVRTLTSRSRAAETRTWSQRIRDVPAHLRLVLDEVEAAPEEIHDLTPGAVVRLDNRTLTSGEARVLMPAGETRFIVDVTEVRATVVGFAGAGVDGGVMAGEVSTTEARESEARDTDVQNAAAHADKRVPVATLPVVLTFTAGRIGIPFGTLADIGPGYVFQLEKRLDDQAILVHANDVPVAVGELVTMGDLIGVRITRMLPRT
jgi:flagellar motor switch/type III secretory pathway protein FliN